MKIIELAPSYPVTKSYFVSTVGGAPLEQVKKYIENQKDIMRLLKESLVFRRGDDVKKARA